MTTVDPGRTGDESDRRAEAPRTAVPAPRAAGDDRCGDRGVRRDDNDNPGGSPDTEAKAVPAGAPGAGARPAGRAPGTRAGSPADSAAGSPAGPRAESGAGGAAGLRAGSAAGSAAGAGRLLWWLRHPVVVTLFVGAALHVLWVVFFANSGGDLAAQDAWAEFVGKHPDSAYNMSWYGGMHPVSYSVVSPYLMSVVGVRTTMMIAGTASCGLLAFILMRSSGVKRPLPPSLAGAFALTCNAVSGRVTFGLGMMFALGAVAMVFCRPRTWRAKPRQFARAGAAALLSALATAGSPVAGLFLGVVAAALFLDRRRPAAYSLGVTPCIVVGLSAWLFPFSGTQPMSLGSAALPLLCALPAVFLVPGQWRTVRIVSAVYALGVLLAWAVDSQVGSNITRLALIYAGVVFLAALPWTAPRSRRWFTLAVAFAVVTGWQAFKTVDDVVRTTPDAAWALELAPLVDRLAELDADAGRVEVVPARSHREASALAPYVNLARGWNRQADLERNPRFYDDSLTPANYHDWLERWAVHYVVLPAGEIDHGGVQEAELIESGLPYLDPVWSDDSWRVYAVEDPSPLAEPPATARRADAGEIVVTVESAGPVRIRIPYSPWLGLVDAEGTGVEPPEPDASGDGYENLHGCLTKEVQEPAQEGGPEDEWTVLHAPRPGTYRLAAPYQLPRGTPCPDVG